MKLLPEDIVRAENPAARHARLGFDHAPVALSLEDFSGVKAVMESWREAGVRDLRSFLRDHPAEVVRSVTAIRVQDVNRRTLELFGAVDAAELIAHLPYIFCDYPMQAHAEDLLQLWEGAGHFTNRVAAYKISGERLKLEIHASIVPSEARDWSHIVVAMQDITQREEASRALAARSAYANGLFEHAPVSLWVEDFSSIKLLLDDLRARGVADLRQFTDQHPEFVARCMAELRILDVNRRTLELFGARSRAELFGRLDQIFAKGVQDPFLSELLELWDGQLFQLREVVNYHLNGEKLHLLLQLSVLPGHEDDWKLVLVGLTDITARKMAEQELAYLGMHDVLTKLFNRFFFSEEMRRLQARRSEPFTAIMLDINGLKPVNDELGHDAGDALLRRAGAVLAQAVTPPCSVARIGGDEFAVLMPECGAEAGQTLLAEIARLIDINNRLHPPVRLEMCHGQASAEPGEALDAVCKRADQSLLDAKRQYYANPARNRRSRHGR
jgi:diguanylate cyclase (GGDEF)-like protein/PAS domain S-box-containing protein